MSIGIFFAVGLAGAGALNLARQGHSTLEVVRSNATKQGFGVGLSSLEAAGVDVTKLDMGLGTITVSASPKIDATGVSTDLLSLATFLQSNSFQNIALNTFTQPVEIQCGNPTVTTVFKFAANRFPTTTFPNPGTQGPSDEFLKDPDGVTDALDSNGNRIRVQGLFTFASPNPTSVSAEIQFSAAIFPTNQRCDIVFPAEFWSEGGIPAPAITAWSFYIRGESTPQGDVIGLDQPSAADLTLIARLGPEDLSGYAPAPGSGAANPAAIWCQESGTTGVPQTQRFEFTSAPPEGDAQGAITFTNVIPKESLPPVGRIFSQFFSFLLFSKIIMMQSLKRIDLLM